MQLFFEGAQDFLPLSLVFSSLLGVQAHNVAPSVHMDFLNLERRGLFRRASFPSDFPITARTGQDLLSDFFEAAHAHTEDVVQTRVLVLEFLEGSALIMPRSATTQKRATWNRHWILLATGISVFTSAVFPGHISQQIGRPFPSKTAPTTIWWRSGLWSLLNPL